MKYFWLILIFFLPVCAHAADDTGGLKIFRLQPPIPASMYQMSYVENAEGQTGYKITVDGKARVYHIYAPPGDAAIPRPAILLLHGSQRTGVSLVEMWKSTADKYGLILIGPDALNQQGWFSATDGPDFLQAVLKDAGQHYNIDPVRTYLFGHSAGASFALYMSILMSDTFAATVIHAGKFSSLADYVYIRRAKRKIPVAFFVGTKDPGYPLDDVRGSAAAFVEAGHEAVVCEIEGHTHWYYGIAPFVNDMAWKFMNMYRLDKAGPL